MGVFDPFLRGHINKKLVPVKLSFNNVSKDINRIQQHIGHLYGHTQQWHAYLHQKSESLEKQFRALREDMGDNLGGKVRGDLDRIEEGLHAFRRELEGQSGRYKKSEDELVALRKQLSHIFDQYNQHFVQLHRRVASLTDAVKEQKYHFSEENLQGQVRSLVSVELEKGIAKLREVEARLEEKRHALDERAQRRATVVESKSELSSGAGRSARPLKDVAHDLSGAEKAILSILASTTKRLSYRDIAAEYGKSPSTVKTILCGLRKFNIPILEVSEGGIKRFYLDPNYRKVILSARL